MILQIKLSMTDAIETELRIISVKAKPQEKQEKEEQKDERVSLTELYRFADCSDYVLLALGIIFAMVAGCSFPWFAYLWGKILDAFLNASNAEIRLSQAVYYRNIFFYLGLGALAASWISFAAWSVLSQRMAVKCRKEYMKSLLKQDIGWFDQQNQFELSAQFNQDALAYQKATGEKLGSMFNLFAMFVCGFAISLSVRWTMSLVIFASFPIIGAGCIVFIYFIHKKNGAFQELYEQADSCSHQALNSIKTVKSLNGEEFQQSRYTRYLNLLKEKVLKWAILAGVGTGIFFFVQYCAFSFGFWYGTHCVAGSYRCPTSNTGSVYTPGEQTIVFFALFVGSFNFMQLLPNILTILQGLKAAKRLYKIIDLEPTIKKNAKGFRKDKLEGRIQFTNVTFAYPKAKHNKILKELSFQTDHGKANAFVGDTGSGKSTIFQLVLRFYDPEAGRVLLDGHDIKQYDLQWLRAQIGYVGQQPCLFEGTIEDNLRIGKNDATQEEIYKALDKAQARLFVEKLPGQLKYNVGYGGSHLSGGQKQRIAIARAIIKNPQILILDEATSALDRRNQKLIQETLDRISQGLTTLVIAHRVKTVMNASKIFVIKRGELLEQGIFRSLQRFKDLQIDIEEAPSKKVQRKESKVQSSNGKEAPAKQIQEQAESSIASQETKYQGSVYGRLFAYTEGKRCLLLIGIITCIIAGAVHPCSALLLANILNEQFNIYPLSKIDTSNSLVTYYLGEAQRYVLYLFLLAIFIFFPFLIQSVIFTIIGEDITQKIRIQVYNKLLKLPVKWFEKRNNQGAATANRFGIDSRQVNGLATSLVSTLTMNFSSIIIGMIFAFVFQWRLGLVGLVAMPCMVIAGFISMLFYGGFGDKNKIYYEQSSRISEEAILNIRTVNSFGYENQLQKIYDEKLQHPLNAAFGKGTKLGLLYGFSQLILQFTFGVLFYFGALIMRDDPSVKLLNILYAIMSITWAGWYAGNNFYFMPDVVSGSQSAKNLFTILDTQDEHQMQIRQSSRLLKENAFGKLQFKEVFFSYNEKSDPILNGISLTIQKGQKVGFVGPSGCGKSTLIQLIQRFYEYEGQIILNGVNIKDFDISYLRSQFSTVNQEPSLFKGSISQNIKYNTGVSEEQIKNAADRSQATTFILQNPQAFERDVGILGSQLSGGQKQRVAIARSLVRKPKILILDEATSALDRNTEKKVQSNIDNEMKDKISIVIAHRIETIMNSSHIYLFDKGDIIQDGTYKELLAKKKYFYNLEKGENLQNVQK